MSENPASNVSYSINLAVDMSSDTIISDSVELFRALEKRLKKEGIKAPINFSIVAKQGRADLTTSGEQIARAPQMNINGNNGGPSVEKWKQKYGKNFRATEGMVRDFGLSGGRNEMAQKLLSLIESGEVTRTIKAPIKYYWTAKGESSASTGEGSEGADTSDIGEVDADECV